MNWMKKALIVFSAASLFCVAGCKKSTDETNNGDQNTAQAVAALLTTSDWKVDEVNALLQFVPEDTSAVYATTRQHDMKSDGFKIMLSKSKSILDNLVNLQAKYNDTTAEAPKEAMAIFDHFKPLLEDFAANAEKWGLNKDAHIDSIAYLNGLNPIAKLTVEDGEKYKSMITPIIDKYTAFLLKEARAHESVFDDFKKSIEDESPIKPLNEGEATAPDTQPAKTTIPDKIATKEVKVGNETWITYDISPLTGSLPFNAVAVNYGAKIVTVTLINGDDTASLENALKPANKPLAKTALGTVSDDTYLLGYVSGPAILNALLANPDTAKEFESDDAKGCLNDLKFYLNILPKLQFTNSIRKDGAILTSSTLIVSDKDELKKLQSLRGEHINIASDKSLAHFGLNLNLTNAIAYAKDLFSRFKSHTFECSMINEIKADQSTLKEADDFFKEASSPTVSVFTDSIHGINLAIDKFTIADGSIGEVEAIVNLTGPTLGKSFPMIAALASMSDSTLGSVLAVKKDEIKEIDISSLIDTPLKVNATLTDTDYILATQNYDLKVLSAQPRKADTSILSYALRSTLLDGLGAVDPIIIDIFKTLTTSLTLDASFAIDDDGFTMKSIVEL